MSFVLKEQPIAEQGFSRFAARAHNGDRGARTTAPVGRASGPRPRGQPAISA